LGNIATDWTPAPEDVDSTLSEVNASISSLKNTTAEKDKSFSTKLETLDSKVAQNTSGISDLKETKASKDEVA
ncbi:hypothetical protein NMU62_11510, partial [Pasteurella multocida]|nr:hypothetical protein [Pasteurella multocida]MDY0440713.1 hypothetical protein [Pasteurella multocida]MDY0444923.1 hypothetical protein [Pasteurella multocida]MDY0447201.1 hypothetical protein [Pasteurella multocida]MDY0449494.1 hypothetical protein [Pasteurella multocida]